MNIVVFSANHRTSTIAERESAFGSAEQRLRVLQDILELPEVRGVVPLDTCNRNEFVLALTKLDELDSIESILRSLGTQKARYSRLVGEDALRHIFRVVSSLDSMVVGEAQISGQVKSAYYEAHASGWTDTSLNRLFHRAFFVSKRVRSSTRIGWGNVSVASLGVSLAEQIVGELSANRVLIVGAGEMGELTLRHLVSRGAKEVVVTNRTPERAWELARRVAGQVRPIEDLLDLIRDSDVIVSAVSTQGKPILSREQVESIWSERGKVLLNLSFPRSIDPEVGALEGVYLYSTEDLRELGAKNVQQREGSRAAAEEIVDEELSRFLSDETHEELGDLSRWVNSEVDREERRLRRRLMRLGLDGEQLQGVNVELRAALDSLAARLIHGKRSEIRSRGRN